MSYDLKFLLMLTPLKGIFFVEPDPALNTPLMLVYQEEQTWQTF